jgi:hypothetical protein
MTSYDRVNIIQLNQIGRAANRAQESGWFGSVLVAPFDLEFDFFFFAGALVLDVVLRTDRHVDALSGDLNPEGLSVFECVCQTPQLGDEIGQRIGFLKVAFLLLAHGAPPDDVGWLGDQR